MSEQDDLARLAQEFVDLWQEHVAAAAADPALLAWSRAWMAPLQAAAAGDDGTAQRTPAPGPAPGDLGSRMDEFARRLAGWEERLAALERGPGKRGGRNADSDRGGRS